MRSRGRYEFTLRDWVISIGIEAGGKSMSEVERWRVEILLPYLVRSESGTAVQDAGVPKPYRGARAQKFIHQNMFS